MWFYVDTLLTDFFLGEDEEQEELKERVERLEEEQNHSSSSSDHERAHSPDVDDW
jgi:hypothetical protein